MNAKKINKLIDKFTRLSYKHDAAILSGASLSDQQPIVEELMETFEEMLANGIEFSDEHIQEGRNLLRNLRKAAWKEKLDGSN